MNKTCQAHFCFQKFLVILMIGLSALQWQCAKASFTGHVQEPIKYYSRTFNATANEIYEAVKWALKTHDYPIESEDLKEGVLVTRWVPVGADSHAVKLFRRSDYGVTGAYHKLELHVVPQGESETKLEVGSRVQSLLVGLESTGR